PLTRRRASARRRRSSAPALEREVRLGCESRDPDAGQVAAVLVDDEPALPEREELPVEDEQVVELEMPLERQQRASLELLQDGEIRLRRKQRGEGREVERDSAVAVRLRPGD